MILLAYALGAFISVQVMFYLSFLLKCLFCYGSTEMEYKMKC